MGGVKERRLRRNKEDLTAVRDGQRRRIEVRRGGREGSEGEEANAWGQERGSLDSGDRKGIMSRCTEQEGSGRRAETYNEGGPVSQGLGFE